MVLRNGVQDGSDRVAEIRNGKLRLFSQGLTITVVDQDRSTAGSMRTIDVTPAIANQKAFAQVDIQSCGCAQKHAGLWLPALARFAMRGAGVKTNFDRSKRRNRRAEAGVHRFDNLAALHSTTNIRLISDHHEKKADGLELRAALHDVRIKLELVDLRGRKRTALSNHWPIEHAVPVQKDGALLYFMLSHFVGAVLSAGCETNKCQTTAWNASVCGVVFMGLTVGIMTQTSAAFAV